MISTLNESFADHVAAYGLPASMADSYNLAAEGPDAIARSVGRVVGLHLADWPRDEVGHDARVLPGEGRGESAAFLAALRDAGWEGTLDVELFSTPEDFWALEPVEAARRACEAVAGLA